MENILATLLGFALSGGGLYSLWHRAQELNRLRATGGKDVMAKIIEITGTRDHRLASIGYTINGEEYVVPLDYYFDSMRVGDTIKICVDEHNPRKFVTVGPRIIGLVLFAVGCIILIITHIDKFITLTEGANSVILGVMAIGLGGLFTAVELKKLCRLRARGRKTMAKVVGIGTKVSGKVKIAYTINGEDYVSILDYLVARHWQIGDTVTIYVDDKNPWDCTYAGGYALRLAGLIFIAFGVIIMASQFI